MRQPTPEEVRGLWDHMQEVYETEVHHTDDVEAWPLVADLLEQVGVVDARAFLRDFAQTVGHTMILPFAPGVPTERWPLWVQVLICVHEHQHVVQYDRDQLGHVIGYSTDTAYRAHSEADAYGTELELTWSRYGTIPPRRPRLLAGLLRSYACSETDIDVAERELVAVARSCERGIVTRPATLTAVAWLDREAAGVISSGG